MIVLDAYALVALLAGEPAAGPVAELVRRPPVGIAAANLTEIAHVAHREYGVEPA